MSSETPLVESFMSRRVVSIEPSKTAFEAAQLMAKEGKGSLVVQREDRAIGIVTERDFVRKIMAKGLNPREVKVEAFMSRPLIIISPRATVFEAANMMGREGIRRLVVMDGEKVAGVFTATDLYRSVFKFFTKRD